MIQLYWLGIHKSGIAEIWRQAMSCTTIDWPCPPNTLSSHGMVKSVSPSRSNRQPVPVSRPTWRPVLARSVGDCPRFFALLGIRATIPPGTSAPLTPSFAATDQGQPWPAVGQLCCSDNVGQFAGRFPIRSNQIRQWPGTHRGLAKNLY